MSATAPVAPTAPVKATKPIVGRFRILAGSHLEEVNGKEIKFKAGDVIDSTSDLSKFNRRGFSPKFERVTNDTPLVSDGSTPTSTVKAPGADAMDAMDLDQLRKFAAEEEINLKGAKTREEVLKVIRAATA